jgi:hypothetical protein
MRVKFIKAYRGYKVGERVNFDQETGMALVRIAVALPDEFKAANKSLKGKSVAKKG